VFNLIVWQAINNKTNKISTRLAKLISKSRIYISKRKYNPPRSLPVVLIWKKYSPPESRGLLIKKGIFIIPKHFT
jgi:hypothetical protein